MPYLPSGALQIQPVFTPATPNTFNPQMPISVAPPSVESISNLPSVESALDSVSAGFDAVSFIETLTKDEDPSQTVGRSSHVNVSTPHWEPGPTLDETKDESTVFNPAQAWDNFLNFIKMIIEKARAVSANVIQAPKTFYTEHPNLAIAIVASIVFLFLCFIASCTPVVVLHIIGLVLRIIGLVLRIIGFGAMGVIKGTPAALFQASYYGAVIPARCLFSLLQSIAMTL